MKVEKTPSQRKLEKILEKSANVDINSFDFDISFDLADIKDDLLQYLQEEGYFVIKAESLAEKLKIELFLEELKQNPYY